MKAKNLYKVFYKRKVSSVELRLLISFTYLIISVPANAQQEKIDSIFRLVKPMEVDTTQLSLHYQLSDEYETVGNYNQGIVYGWKALDIAGKILKSKPPGNVIQTALKYKAKSYCNIGIIYSDQGNSVDALKYLAASLKIFVDINDQKGIASCYNNIGNVYDNLSDNSQALKYYTASLKIRKAIGDLKGVGGSYNNMGLVHANMGNYPEALKNYFECLKIMDSIGEKRAAASALNNIGLIYSSQNNNAEALKNHLEALKIRKEIGHKRGLGSSYGNIGIIYEAQGNWEEALKSYLQSLKIREEIGHKEGIASALNSIGNVFFLKGNREKGANQSKQFYTEAMKNFMRSAEIKNEIGDKAGIVSTYLNIGNLYIAQKNYIEGKLYLKKAEIITKEIGFKNYFMHLYGSLAVLDSIEGDFKSAFKNHKLFVLYRDSLDNEETRKMTVQNQMNYDFQKKEAIAEAEHKKELYNQGLLAEERNRKQNLIILFVACGLLLVIFFAGFIYRSLQTTRKQKKVIEIQKDLVESQKIEVEYQKQLVEEHQKEIIDSITYAKRIIL
ncbi:MAG: photosystem assembly protein Ycf3 [Bacteroidetes bacterium]|nr:photosystem assembly protein Ycf3 [Bacteroidota bacterium]